LVYRVNNVSVSVDVQQDLHLQLGVEPLKAR
jgi:hypothetical protein